MGWSKLDSGTNTLTRTMMESETVTASYCICSHISDTDHWSAEPKSPFKCYNTNATLAQSEYYGYALVHSASCWQYYARRWL